MGYSRSGLKDSSTVKPDITNLYITKELVLITNDVLQPSKSKMYGKQPLYNEPLL